MPLATALRDPSLGEFPALDTEKKIMELGRSLWERREEIKTRNLQLAPYDAHFNSERFLCQVFYLLQSFVQEHCKNFRKKSDDGNEIEEIDPDFW